MIFKPGKFGKLAPKHNAKTLNFAKYVTSLPMSVPPTKIFWEYRISSWGMLGNDDFGCCTCAGPAHEIMNRTVHSGTLVAPTLDDVLGMYAAICPGFNRETDANDNGAAITDALNHLQATGLCGHKIAGWAKIDQSNIDHVKLAIYLFGSINIGVTLPNIAMEQFSANKPWDVVENEGGIDGGHCIPLMGYGTDGATCITWGARQQMSWAWFAKYCDEAYVELAPDWFNVNGETPGHLNMTALQADLKMLGLPS